ncbi:type II toxin-antitoxin system RelB/DinJ family antitoxin [Candidatus Falkowbacteria bacterium]|nr:type II toxin-antitoxin system RelB/DinJ family antitoxin [Deltaproteobacteria bacterium]MBT4525427.1 type II toxin-antitoxin system RelB/DinJ family antitoxin [Deltaproteobacteria bacterium]MBT7007082.1 type II toxin-antitoxin system RelB/DinJ family antitoxin [Candidatus Falkowbacteria bacterium]
MEKSATIQARINLEVKREAQRILSQLHISMSEAIAMYLTQITLHQGIPFEIRIPNELTQKTLKESEDGKNLHQVNNVSDLFEELNC